MGHGQPVAAAKKQYEPGNAAGPTGSETGPGQSRAAHHCAPVAEMVKDRVRQTREEANWRRVFAVRSRCEIESSPRPAASQLGKDGSEKARHCVTAKQQLTVQQSVSCLARRFADEAATVTCGEVQLG